MSMAVRNGYSPRKLGTILDVTHIVIGLAVVIMAIFAFLNPERYKVLFPVIFLLAAVLNVTTGWLYMKMYPRMKKKRASGFIYVIAGLLIFALCVISAASIWGSL